jgi:small subunit ribosomal protein S3Ae
MALARARQAARRVKDRWKSKQWYQITAPASFSHKLIAETMADEPAKLMDRRIVTTLYELTGDMKQMHVKLQFKVHEVLDTNAKAVFDGHTMTSDYVRRLTRRGATKISHVFDVQTKDGGRVRVKPFAITDRRCQTTQAQAIRRTMQTQIEAAAKDLTLNGLLAEILVGDLNLRIQKEARKVHPVRRVEIAKTEILRAPAVETDETPVLREAPPPSADSEEEAVPADASEEE